MAAVASSFGSVKEVLPPSLNSSSEPPAHFDGTTRLYISYICPFAQRPWIVRNFTGLHEKVKLVPIDLQNRPDWYEEKIYPGNKVLALEHNNEVKGEGIDLIKFIDETFEGPKLLPDDPTKRLFAEELFSYGDKFNIVNFKSLPSPGDIGEEVVAAFDKLEDALSKFGDGPFFLGQFSLVDIIAYALFIEGFQYSLTELKKYDITKRPKLALWIEELNKIDAYTYARQDPKELLAVAKKRLGIA